MNNIIAEVKDRIGYIIINRPKALNALNRETLTELKEAIAGLAHDEEVAVLIITGTGDKAFVAGADIKEMEIMTPQEAKKFALLGHEVFSLLEQIARPVIAAVNGFALGGGCELALACDIRYAAEHAKFGQPEVGLGITAGFGGTQRLPRLVGKGTSLELLFTGKIINAEEAYRIGLVQKVAPNVLEEATKLANSIVSNGPLAVRQTKQVIVNGMEMDLNRALAYEAEIFAMCFSSTEQKEGMSAFCEKRAPKFQ